MNQLEAFLEKTWDALLSRDSGQIAQSYENLDADSQHVVVEHLKKMTSESGWLQEQIISARVALQVILALGEK